jgi:hypothetical protein
MTIICLLALAAQDSLEAVRVDTPPAVDGDASDKAWEKAKPLVVSIKKAMADDPKGLKVTLKAVVSGETIYFLAQWADETKDDVHKPWVWNKTKYAIGEQQEDVCTLAFQLQGEFNSNMLSPIDAKWDVWQWKAARTNPVGYAMDKTHVYSPKPFSGGKAHTISEGKMYMARPEDAGKSATKVVPAPEMHAGDVVPRFVPQEPDGSAADVNAKGQWKDKQWTVEFARKLKTGNADDRAFAPGEKVGFAVAVFDHCESEDHSVSPELDLLLPK